MRARYGACRRLLRSAWLRAGGVLVVMAAGAQGGAPVLAAEPDCQAVGSKPFTVSLMSDGHERAQFRLRKGDALTFELQGGGARGSITLTHADGSGGLLLDGTDGARASFVASHSGSFDFRFANRGSEPATFAATCLPADRGRAEKRRKDARSFARLPTDIAIDVPADDGPAFAEFATALPPMGMPNADAPALAAPRPKDPDTGLAFNMDLRDHRYVPGPYGVQVDPAASGVNVGVNYKMQPAIMVGALAQFDQATETAIGGSSREMTEKAWMAGPVTKLELAPGVALDAKAAWGYADMSVLDLSTHAPSMPRGLVSARLSNTQTLGGWRITPSVNVSRSWDTMVALGASATDAYVTSTVAAGRVDVGPELAYRLDLANASFIEPRVAVGSFWGLDGLSSATLPVHGDMRLKAEAGVTFGMGDGAKLQMGGAIEEGDRTVPDAWSGRVQMSVPLK